MSFKQDLKDAKIIETEVAKILDCDSCIVTQGFFPYDILANKGDKSFRIEIKYHRDPKVNIPYEVFNCSTLKALGIAVTEADYWIDVISEPPTHERKTIWITKVEVLREKLKQLVVQNPNIMTKKDSNGDRYTILSVPMIEVKKYAECRGEFKLY